MKFALVFALAASAMLTVNAAAKEAPKSAVKATQPKSIFVDMKGLKAAKNLTVLKATYGTDKKNGFDVTALVKDFVAKKKDIPVGNYVFKKDPAPGKSKTLEIIYTVNNQIKIITAKERATLKFTAIK